MLLEIKLELESESLKSLLKHRPRSQPDCQISQVLGLAWELAFLTNPQVRLMLLARNLHFENHSSKVTIALAVHGWQNEHMI